MDPDFLGSDPDSGKKSLILIRKKTRIRNTVKIDEDFFPYT